MDGRSRTATDRPAEVSRKATAVPAGPTPNMQTSNLPCTDFSRGARKSDRYSLTLNQKREPHLSIARQTTEESKMIEEAQKIARYDITRRPNVKKLTTVVTNSELRVSCHCSFGISINAANDACLGLQADSCAVTPRSSVDIGSTPR